MSESLYLLEFYIFEVKIIQIHLGMCNRKGNMSQKKKQLGNRKIQMRGLPAT